MGNASVTVAAARPQRWRGVPAGLLRAVSSSIPTRSAVIAWVLLIALGAVFAAEVHSILPGKFFYDSAHIQDIAQHGLAAGGRDYSFIAVGEVYNILHLQNSPLVTAILSFVVLAAVDSVVLVRICRARGAMPLLGLIVLAISLGAGCVYLTSYSKDAVVLVLGAIVLAVAGRRGGDVVIVGAVLLYALCFRQYWALVAVAYIVLRLVDRFAPRRWITLIVPAAFIVAVAILYPLVTHVDVGAARQTANEFRTNSVDARSIIHSYIPVGGPLGDALNSVVTLATLVIPVPLAALGGAYYGGAAVALAFFWVTVVHCWMTRGTGSDSLPAGRVLALAIALVTVQAIFEPDYGSAIRHLSPLLPVAALGIGLASGRWNAESAVGKLTKGRHAL